MVMRVCSWQSETVKPAESDAMNEGRGFSNAKAKRELGWQLRNPSWRIGFKEGLV